MASSAPARLVVRSIGTASFSIIAGLRQISTLTEQELAERLFRAPSELFAGVPRQTAEKAAEVLRSAGLQVDVLGEVFEPDEFLAQLEAEHRVKPEVRQHRGIGFVH